MATFRRAAELSGEFPLILGWLGCALGLGKCTEEARLQLERFPTIARERFVLPSSLAWLHLGLVEIDDAFMWMERAAERNNEWIHPLKIHSFLDPLRSDPRFQKLLHMLSLEP